MNGSSSDIPWSTPPLWQEANAALEHLLQRHGPRLEASRRAAEEIRNRLASLFPIMDRLCRATCPECADICCHHACVWVDFKDLLFSHLAGIKIPAHQLIRHRFERCRYATPSGCGLDRFQRPFICTWYLCPAQTQKLRGHPSEWQKVASCLHEVKHQRKQMERCFYIATSS